MNEFKRMLFLRLHFYDTHRLDRNMKYNRSSMSTVLILPSAEFKIKDYSYLIDKFANENKRVLALVFPGMNYCHLQLFYSILCMFVL